MSETSEPAVPIPAQAAASYPRPRPRSTGRPTGEPSMAREADYRTGRPTKVAIVAAVSAWRFRIGISRRIYEPVTRTAMDCRSEAFTNLKPTATSSGPKLGRTPVLMLVPATANG